MSWNYGGDPSASDKDYVRFLIGDTIPADELLQDEEINAVLVVQPNVYLASAICCEAIAGKFSRLADTTVGKTSLSYSQKAKAYLELAKRLRIQYRLQFKAVPYAGGISKNDKKIDEDNSDRVKPFFERDLFTNKDSEEPKDDDYGL